VDIKWDGYLSEPYYSQKQTLDLRVYENCLEATKHMDYVYNLAADMGGIGYITRVSADVQRNNVLINSHMLEASLINDVNRYFFSSSACVYPNYLQGESAVTPLKEGDAVPADPNEAYGWEKLFTEVLCESFRRDYDMNIRVARYHNVYGPEGTWSGGREKAPAALCRKVAETRDGGEIVIWGDGKQTRSFLYIDDCLDASIALMNSKHVEPINVGSDRLVTIDELADIIIAASGKTLSKRYDPTKPQGVRGRNADLSLVKKVLGWAPRVSLEDGLAETYKWVEKQVEQSINHH